MSDLVGNPEDRFSQNEAQISTVLGFRHFVLGSGNDMFNCNKSKRKAMNRNWYNQKANPALNTKAGNK